MSFRECRIEFTLHIVKSTRNKILEVRWTVVPNPPYSPDLADDTREKNFDDEDLKWYLINFSHKSLDFHER